MRHIFIALGVFGLCGCEGTPPYMNLEEPIYMVTDQSFWVGCENSQDGYEFCQEIRVALVENGVNEWFKHFDEATRPQVVIVSSEEELPPNRVNSVIYLKVKSGGCFSDGKYHQACYHWEYGESPEMRFDAPDKIMPYLVAHEFGHALGRGHEDTAEDVYSIMSYTLQSYVVPVDIDLLCEMHAECPPHENTWCKGEFYDPCRCPSASFEEGAAMLAAGTLTCAEGEDKMAEVRKALREID